MWHQPAQTPPEEGIRLCCCHRGNALRAVLAPSKHRVTPLFVHLIPGTDNKELRFGEQELDFL